MSRRENRYKRRVLARQKAKADFLSQFTFDKMSSYEALYDSAKQAGKGVSWKASVQRYLLNLPINTVKAHTALENGEDMRKGFICFDVNERGKTRHIQSVHFSERVIQKSLCRNILLPVLTHNIIYDNGASQKGKGTKFAIDRLVKHLRWHYNKYGRKGYILLIDFKGYFENIDHNTVKQNYRMIRDERILKLTDSFVDAFDRGLGLGSETSQMHAIYYPNKADHFIKDQCGIKCYGRYMDDSYIILPDKEKLLHILHLLRDIYKSLKITVNEKKTCIKDLRHGFTYLKTRFMITDTGKILRRPCRKAITNERRKIKKQLKILPLQDVIQSFTSWCGSVKRKNAYKSVQNLKLLFDNKS